jgi:hypothetical protein
MKTFQDILFIIQTMGYGQTIDCFHKQLFINCFPNILHNNMTELIEQAINKTKNGIPRHSHEYFFVEYAENLLNNYLEVLQIPKIFMEDFIDGGNMRFEYSEMIRTVNQYKKIFSIFNNIINNTEVVVVIENNDIMIPMQ